MKNVNYFFLILMITVTSGLIGIGCDILYVLQEKIILCTGPAFEKREQLIEITQQDISLIPFKKIFVITNDENLTDISFQGIPTKSFYFPARGKQLDCLNYIIHSIIQVAQDKECKDNDIILFKHESVYINDLYLICKAVDKIMQGYDIVAKYWVGRECTNGLNFDDYYHTDSFFLSVYAARKLAKELHELYELTQDYRFCEEYFTKYMVNKLLNVYKIDYHHSSWKDNELGLYHIPRYEEDSQWYWDKKNYYELYA